MRSIVFGCRSRPTIVKQKPRNESAWFDIDPRRLVSEINSGNNNDSIRSKWKGYDKHHLLERPVCKNYFKMLIGELLQEGSSAYLKGGSRTSLRRKTLLLLVRDVVVELLERGRGVLFERLLAVAIGTVISKGELLTRFFFLKKGMPCIYYCVPFNASYKRTPSPTTSPEVRL